MTFDPTKPCRTRRGCAVEILAVLPAEKATPSGQTIVALVHDECGCTVETYRHDGCFCADGRESTLDLVNVDIPEVEALKWNASAIEAALVANGKGNSESVEQILQTALRHAKGALGLIEQPTLQAAE